MSLRQKIFESFVQLLATDGDIEEISIEKHAFRRIESNELSLVQEYVNDDWVSNGIGFSLFGLDLFLSSDGNVSFAVDENEVYSISDETMLKNITEFLGWRLNVLKTSKM